ncbi:DUF5615 family PIN-like protein [Candidatus Daviesbacteria bacterium]|nr:DUF5615 family PIN-like protein [Candidatus Daviesbacteria bacterium]
MARHFYKHKILLDENFYYRHHLPKLNRAFDVKHIVDDFHQTGLKDPQVYKFARNRGRILVTFNFDDFRELAKTSNTIGVVGVSNNILPDDIDKKLTALFTKRTKKSLFGKLTIVSGET